VSEIPELRKQLKRYTDEVRKLRDEVEPSRWKQHERLQKARAAARSLAERVSELEHEERVMRPELEAYAGYNREVTAAEREADPELMQRLLAAVRESAPTRADDPRLADWYHTVELGNGLCSTAPFDLRSTVDLHGFPESLEGKTALDVGTCDGFWAFEMERRGADRVVAIDVERWADFDWFPWVRESKSERALNRRMDNGFWLAHAMRGSRVEHRFCSVYDLSPDSVGTFDVVFCGSLLMHLQNPLGALVNIRSVTREMAIVATLLSEEVEQAAPDKPWLSFGHRWPDLEKGAKRQLGSSCVYWHVNTRGLRELMEYAGFARTESLEPVQLTPTSSKCAVVVGYPDRSAE
jgi:2-polyprenyl-3-methyl-5-hydroxy-6-metoxy-1,4-benzoquinol methylase